MVQRIQPIVQITFERHKSVRVTWLRETRDNGREI